MFGPKGPVMGLRSALIVVAHSDDEALMAGGTIAKIASSGVRVFCVSFTDGVSSRNDSPLSEQRTRSEAAERAAETLGFEWIREFGLPDQMLDLEPVSKLARLVEDVKHELDPDLVITHSSSDLNADHRRVLEATLIAFRPVPGENRVTVLSGEVVSATHWGDTLAGRPFSPNVLVDISDEFEQKRAALKAYSDEMRQPPHARSLDAIDSLSKFRGSTVGVQRAEAFELIRTVLG